MESQVPSCVTTAAVGDKPGAHRGPSRQVQAWQGLRRRPSEAAPAIVWHGISDRAYRPERERGRSDFSLADVLPVGWYGPGRFAAGSARAFAKGPAPPPCLSAIASTPVTLSGVLTRRAKSAGRSMGHSGSSYWRCPRFSRRRAVWSGCPSSMCPCSMR